MRRVHATIAVLLVALVAVACGGRGSRRHHIKHHVFDRVHLNHGGDDNDNRG